MCTFDSHRISKYEKACSYLLFFLFIQLLFSHTLAAQNIISSQGNYHKGTDMNVSWTIGETIVDTKLTQDLSLTQGFHQPLISVQRVNSDEALQLSANVYPNPTDGHLKVAVDLSDPIFTIELIDNNGKRVNLSSHVQSLVDFNLVDHPAGTYYLKLQDAKSEQKAVFKVMKL